MRPKSKIEVNKKLVLERGRSGQMVGETARQRHAGEYTDTRERGEPR